MPIYISPSSYFLYFLRGPCKRFALLCAQKKCPRKCQIHIFDIFTMSPHSTNKRDVNVVIEINNNNNNNGMYQLPSHSLKINKDSHFIKKSPSSSSSSPSSSASSSISSLVNAVVGPAGARQPQQQQRHPVIIYTHSPKIIHTHPRDFMALVQKLTGLSRFDEDAQVAPQPQQQQPPRTRTTKAESGEGLLEEEMMSGKGAKVVMRNQNNDSSSVITTEDNCSSTNINNNSNINVGFRVGVGGGGDGHVQMNSCIVQPNPYIGGIPVFTPNAADFYSSNPINHLFTI